MRDQATAADVVKAVVRAIEATFDASDWQNLALETGHLDLVNNHPRLLRSLGWGDDDYLSCVISVVPTILGVHPGKGESARTAAGLPNLVAVERAVGLERWLRDNDASMHHVLYGDSGQTVLDEMEDVTDWLSVPDIDRHAIRIRQGLISDPAQALGSAKELLESVFKAILELHGHSKDTRADLLPLMTRVNQQLGLQASGIRDSDPGAEQRRRIAGSLNQLVQSVSELRNAGFGTGHGGSRRDELDLATVRLTVTAAVATASFYAETHREQIKRAGGQM